jgi:hypothetical protein
VITSSILDEAMERFMPKQAPMDKLAEAVAIGRAHEQPVSLCKSCGLTASQPDPEVCTVCGGINFEVLTAEMVETLVTNEGGASEEPSYDGRKLSWTQQARSALRSIDSAYLRRRTKARIEKAVRLRRLKTVTLEFAQELIEEETGEPLAAAATKHADDNPTSTPPAADLDSDGNRLIARDAKNVPLFSTFDWSEDAVERILRVPPGFMRDRTQARIEALAEAPGNGQIDLARVEAGIELGLQTMAEMVAEGGDEAVSAAGETPNEQTALAAQCPAIARTERTPGQSSQEYPLNEVSQLTELAAMRMLLTQQEESEQD